MNYVQRHTNCHSSTCLRKRNNYTTYRYGSPWELHESLSMYIDAFGCKTYVLARNDDKLNVQNPHMLAMGGANIDFQPILSRHAILKYISKYAAKPESKYQSYHQILARLAQSSPLDAPPVNVIHKILTKLVANRDISVQETCHMLQKIPLTQ